eukprot:GHVL01009610.1.p1 GENE.GHVL01009610.1~~GHVL01009610.1.p1  ORF type:complete len:254 (+),score=44.57 GHVL01009610.1:722-1483(+)
MQEVRHPNIAGLLDVYADGLSLCLVMDFLPMDLSKLLQDKAIRFSESHIKCIAHQIISGVKELHAWNFLHRDLSPANVMFDHSGVCKLGDFGLSRFHGSPHREMSPRVVTIYYRAPELLFGAPFYGAAIDIWAVGCILVELFAEKPLFRTTSASELSTMGLIFQYLGTPSKDDWPEVESLPWYCEFEERAGKKPSEYLPTGIPKEGVDLIMKMIQLNPSRRISAADALDDIFFKTPPLACTPAELAKHFRLKK